MITPPTVLESTAQHTAVIRLKVPAADIMTVMGPGVQELFGVLAAQGIAPAGPWFTYHRHKPTDIFDIDISVPVATPVIASGRVEPSVLPARRVARTVYHGGYEGLGAAWGEFEAWIEAYGHTSARELWECYTTGPESGPDATAYRTELNRPLVITGVA